MSTSAPSLSASAALAQKGLGRLTLTATTVGLGISQVGLVGVLQSLGLAANYPVWVLALAFVCAYLLALTYAATFSELSLMMPHRGGLSTYTEVALGNLPALLATYSGYVVVNLFGVPVELMLLDSVLREVVGIAVPSKLLALGVLWLLAGLNIKGPDVFAALQNTATVFKVVLVVVIITVAFVVTAHPPAPGVAPSKLTGQIGFGMIVGLFFWCFVGAELVCPMINDVRRPERSIPSSMFWGLTILAVLYGLYTWGARKMLPASVLSSSLFPHLEYCVSLFGKFGAIVLLFIAISGTVGVVNPIISGVSSMLAGMAKNGQAFAILAREHPRHGTPWIAILVLAACFSVPILCFDDHAESITNLVVAASMSWLIAYVIAHVNLIVLRRRYPKAARPFRSPWFPLPQLVGIVGMVYVIGCNPPEVNRLAGYVLGGVALMSVIWIRLVMKRGLFMPVKLNNSLPSTTSAVSDDLRSSMADKL